MIVRANKGTGISGAVRYVMGEGKRDPLTGKVPELEKGERSRVAWYGGTGFGFPIDSDERLEIARRVMEWSASNQASRTKKCQTDCLHLMLAWDKDEQPSRSDMEGAALSVLERLGMGNARAIWACHDDTDHHHLHIVASRIDPESGKAFSDSFDKTVLSAWALEYERSHGGIKCQARLDRENATAERDPEKVINAFAARRETFTERDLSRALSKAIPSRDTRRTYIAGVLTRDDIVRLYDLEHGTTARFTTRQTLAAEALADASGMMLFADRSFRVSGSALHGVLQGLKAEGKVLRTDQAKALEHATGEAGIAVIAGKAGTGKSFTMKAIQDAYLADGCQVQTLAPTNKVASALKRDGLTAGTIHSVLGSLDRGKTQWTDQTVVMVDEAGMVSTRLMARLLSHAEHAGAKVVLVGDEKQLASIDRGGMFGYYAESYGSAELSEITRQRGADQRELATRASDYDFVAALSALDAQGKIVRAESEGDRITQVAKLWRERTQAAPQQSMFVIAVSNADAEAANQAIRQVRRERGELGVDHRLTTADGERSFATGDRVLFAGSALTRKGREAGLANGNSAVVTAIDGATLTVAIDGAPKGQTLSVTVGPDREAGEFNAIRHGYAGTIYKAQGATYDQAIVLDSAAMRAATGYVALTRHRDQVTVVTSRSLAQVPQEPWIAATNGLEGLSEAQRQAAEKSYATWRAEKPENAAAFPLGRYVSYVQRKHAQSLEEGARQADTVAGVRDMARRWSRSDDRRAALRFEMLGDQSLPIGTRTPAEVRAAVGVEAFEEGVPLPGPIAPSTEVSEEPIPEYVSRTVLPKTEAPMGAEASDASGNGRPWTPTLPPVPQSAAEERAMLRAFVAPFVTQIQQQGELEHDEAARLRWWERMADRWQETQRWARETWGEMVAKGRGRDNNGGPDKER